MTRAELEQLYSADLEIHGPPIDKTHFCLSFQAMIAPSNVEVCHTFQIEICTPSWLASECATQGVVWGRHMFIVGEYDLDQIKFQIEACLKRCAGEAWMEVVKQFSKFAQWEFEDYQPA
jgi:hypothetical protein